MKTTMLKLTVVLLLCSAAMVALTATGVAVGRPGQEPAAAINPTEETAGQTGQNIRVLKELPRSQLYPVMRFMAASLGFQCGSCHVIKDGRIDPALDDKPEKQTARQMIKMVIEINKAQFQGAPAVSCYTCHRGHRTPQGAPDLPLPAPRPTGAPSEPTASNPATSSDEVLRRYLAAIGGDAAATIKSCSVKGTTTTATGQTVAYEVETVTPDKGRETFAIRDENGRCAGDSRCEYERVINGTQGWLKSGAGVQDLAGEQLGDQKLSFPLFSILKLKDQYSNFRFAGRDKIDDHDVYVLRAVRLDGKSEQLYFDFAAGLLRRRVSYLRTLIGMIPSQTDYEDYREVNGVKLPFLITTSYDDSGSRPIVRKFEEIELNTPVAESKFGKPR
jgi:hypothetical protein